MHQLKWKQATQPVICRLCGFEGSGRQVLTLKTAAGLTIAPVECPVCLSLDIVDEPIPFAESQEQVDIYVEVGAGIDTIASLISCVDTSSVSSFVDIGCGYGFSLYLAEGLYGWRSYGYEPSPLAEAGIDTLGVDIRNEPFTRESKFIDPPDYVFSSEVIEHIPDPLEFLSTIREQLPEGAVLVMTTPNRSCVNPSAPEPELMGALSPGFHVLVASVAGIRLLAERAGFAHCEVRESAERLIVAMAHTSAALAGFAIRDVSRVAMDDWYVRTILSTAPGTPLRIGLASRLLDSFVAQGDFPRARPVADALLVDMKLRFDGFDIARILARGKPSLTSALFPLIAGLCYNLGMLSLLGDQDPQCVGALCGVDFCWRSMVRRGGYSVPRTRQHGRTSTCYAARGFGEIFSTRSRARSPESRSNGTCSRLPCGENARRSCGSRTRIVDWQVVVGGAQVGFDPRALRTSRGAHRGSRRSLHDGQRL